MKSIINKIPVLFLLIFAVTCTGESFIKSVQINKKASGSTVNINLSDTLIINLTSNPTTGYSWSIAENDSTKIKFINKNHESSLPKITGSGGKEIFKFLGVEAGMSKIKMVYTRSWEKNIPPADSMIVFIQIKN